MSSGTGISMGGTEYQTLVRGGILQANMPSNVGGHTAFYESTGGGKGKRKTMQRKKSKRKTIRTSTRKKRYGRHFNKMCGKKTCPICHRHLCSS